MSSPAHSTAPVNPSTPAIVLALAVLGLLCVGGLTAFQAARMVPGTVVSSQIVAQAKQPSPVAATTISTPLFAGPGWGLMTRSQKLALYPLAERWDYMSKAQKNRWLVLAESFAEMPAEEQQKLHDRMVVWAGLSAQQRSQARLTFATAKAFSSDDIREQWEAYQALTEAQKTRLAATAPKPRGAATALKPVARERLAHVPTPTYAQSQSPNPPKIVFPTSTAVREPASAAPVDLAPVLPREPQEAATKSGSDTTAPAYDPDEALPSDPLPPLYIN